MQNHHLFLSDVHLGAFDKRQEEVIRHDLIELIQYCSDQNIKIHIHGDLFDYWMEYPQWRPDIGREVLQAFSRYMDRHGPVNFVTGNHDNWTYGYFSDLGFNVSRDFFDLSIGSIRLFLHHGDGISDPKLNFRRPFYHRMLRNKLFVRMYQSLLSRRVGITLMQLFSNYSKRRAYSDTKVLDTWSKYLLKETDYNAVVCGHDHHPRVQQYHFGTYINTGTFFTHRTIGLYTNGELKLVVWDAAEKSFTDYKNSANRTELT